MVPEKDADDQVIRLDRGKWTEHGFATIPRWLLHDESVSAHAKLVFVTLSSFVSRSGVARVKHATLAATCGLSVAAARRAIDELERLGVLERTARWSRGHQRANGYMLRVSQVGEPVDNSEEDETQGAL